MESRDVVLRKTGEGRGYYEGCQTAVGLPGVAGIFALLSEDEQRHADALKAQQDGIPVDLDQSHTLDGARFILRNLAVQLSGLEQLDDELVCVSRAMDFEAASVRLYGQLAREAKHHWEKELYLRIAADDEMHFTLLEQMRELLETLPEDVQEQQKN